MPTRMLCDANGIPIIRPTKDVQSPSLRKDASFSDRIAEKASFRTKESAETTRTIAALLRDHRVREANRRTADAAAAVRGGTATASAAGRKRARTSAVGSPASSSSSSSSASGDVLAVVIAVNDPRYGDSPNSRKLTVDLTVGDGSLPPGRAARVALKVPGRELPPLAAAAAASASAPAESSSVRAGDVLLFHGLAVRRDYGDDDDDITAASVDDGNDDDGGGGGAISGALATVLCELYRPWWKDEEATATATAMMRPFTRLSRASWHREEDRFFDGGRNANTAAMTSGRDDGALRERVERVAAWYNRSHRSDAFVSPSRSLGGETCRRRRLRDVDAPGLLSDVTVRVLSYDGDAPRPPGLRGSSPMRRKKGTRRCWGTGSATSCASISDGPAESDLATLYDCRRFEAALNSAIRSGSRVLVTRVRSRRISGRDDDDAGGIALAPTSETSVVALGGEDPSVPGSGKRGGRRAASQRDDGTQTQGITQTQQLPSPQSLRMQETVVVASTLKDIVVSDGGKEVSLKTRFSEPPALMEILIDTTAMPRPVYQSATLTLDCDAVPRDCIAVKAESDIVEVLCGSCPAEDLTFKAVGGTAENKDLLRSHVFDLLRGMLHEKITLKWTLQRTAQDEQWHVLEVMLPEI